jgi:hypothetical protein
LSGAQNIYAGLLQSIANKYPHSHYSFEPEVRCGDSTGASGFVPTR